MNIDDLIECIKESMVSMAVVVPDTDCYAKRGQTTSTTIDYVCPHRLIEALEVIQSAKEQ